MNITKNTRFGVIGGSTGMGKWICQYFSQLGYETKFTSLDAQTQYKSNEDILTASEIIIIAVPISSMEQVLAEIYPYSHQKIIIDICSVKHFIIKKLKKLHEAHPSIIPQYISLHPMFGPSITEVNGQTILITHQQDCENSTLIFFKNIFQERGAIIYEIDYERHDKIMAIIQGLNHFNVFISAKTLSLTFEDLDLIKKLSSPTYRIFLLFYTRYVLQSPKLYAEIQIFNPYIKEIISLFMEESKKFLSLIEEKNFDGFESYIYSMQPFFQKNKEDSLLSDILIKELGNILSPPKTRLPLEQKIQKMKLLILDVDATMTDGGIYITDEGIIFKKFHVKDGVGIKNLMQYGIQVGFISHSHSKNIVQVRAEILGVERWYAGKESKEIILAEWLQEMNISFEEVGMVGDDINDISLMEKVGFVACPADAVDSVKKISDVILSLKGGDGCIRELIDSYIFPIHTTKRNT